MKKRAAFLVLALALCWGSIAKAEELAVNVEAESPAYATLLTNVIRDVYPFLDSDQQELVRAGLVFKAVQAMGNAVAYGPEDDPDYRYPDRTLYPKGTIKANLAPMFFALVQKVYGEGLPLTSSYGGMLVEIIAHEIKHVQQYIANPVFALAHAEDCPKGLCDDVKLMATHAKLQYELEATLYGQRKYYAVTKKPEPENFDRLIEKHAMRFYGIIYEPPMLVKKCVANTLTREERVLAEEYIKRPAMRDYAEEYPYLTPVLGRLKTCMESQ